MADCTCIYAPRSPEHPPLHLVWRDPRCPIHYERPRFYGQDGNEVPAGEKFPPEMKVG